MGNPRLMALCLIWLMPGWAWAQQAPGLATNSSTQAEHVRLTPGLSYTGKVMQAPGASGSHDEVLMLRAENARLRRQVDVLEEMVKVLQDRVRTLEKSP